jgi:hypothetical protein
MLYRPDHAGFMLGGRPVILFHSRLVGSCLFSLFVFVCVVYGCMFVLRVCLQNLRMLWPLHAYGNAEQMDWEQ